MRSISALRPAVQASSSRHFSTAPVVLAKRQELVELLVEHPTLGSKGDRVFVQPGHARHRLIPHRVARLVPHWRWFGIKPFKKVAGMGDALQIEGPRRNARSFFSPSSRRSFSTSASVSRTRRRGERMWNPDEPAPRDVVNKFEAIPAVITFKRPVVDGTKLQESVRVADIIKELRRAETFDDRFSLVWSSGDNTDTPGEARMEKREIVSTGSRGMNIRLEDPDRRKIVVDIVVESE